MGEDFEPAEKPRRGWYQHEIGLRGVRIKLVAAALCLAVLLAATVLWLYIGVVGCASVAGALVLAACLLVALVNSTVRYALGIAGWVRRHRQYSLRSLIIFVSMASLVASGIASWWTWHLRYIEEYGRIRVKIAQLGGSVQGDPSLGSKGIARIHFWSSSLTDAEQSTLVEHLKTLSNLKELWLDIGSFSDRELEHLKGLTSLRELKLNGTQVSDAGLEHLKGLTNLRELQLDGTQVSDAGLEHLKGLTNLRELQLHDTKITDAGLERLKTLTNLRELWLCNTQVSDAGLKHLGELTRLGMLHLEGTQVSDAGLETLGEFSNLYALYLKNTQVTDAGAKRLKQTLPNCGIFNYPVDYP